MTGYFFETNNIHCLAFLFHFKCVPEHLPEIEGLFEAMGGIVHHT